MTARFVLVCDVCGAVSDDHYPYPVARARTWARATGWSYRKVSTTPGDYAGHHASYHRYQVDLCPEHTYEFTLRGPHQREEWNRNWQRRQSRWHRDGEGPEPLQPIQPEPHIRYDTVQVVYVGGQGPYKLYTALAQQLKGAGITRSQLERLRREMFAPDADFVTVAARWADIQTDPSKTTACETENSDQPQRPNDD
jgi:hypothetical protein